MLPRRDDGIIAALDIGASKASCFIGHHSREPGLAPYMELIGVGHIGLPLTTKTVASVSEVERAVRGAIEAAERMAGLTISAATVALPGRFLKARRIGVDLELGGRVVTQEDIDDSFAEAAMLIETDDETAMHINPSRLVVDGLETCTDPLGFAGDVLSIEMLTLSARNSVLDYYYEVAGRCDLDIVDFIPAPVAAAEACLIEDEKELGVIFIDIGAAAASFAVYDNGALVYCAGVPLGGGHVTRDIAQIFGAPIVNAERVKTLQGAALVGPGDENRHIEFPQLGMSDERISVSRAELCDVIIPRMEEIFELVLRALPDDQIKRSGLRRAVISGGGSLLVGARETAERVLGMKSRLGRPHLIAGAPDAASAPGFAVSAGMIENYKKFGALRNSSIGGYGQSLHAGNSAGVIGGVSAWLRAKF